MNTKTTPTVAEVLAMAEKFDFTLDRVSVSVHELAEFANQLTKKLSYPMVDEFAKYNVYKDGKCLGEAISKAELDVLRNKHSKVLVEEIDYRDALRKARVEYSAKTVDINEFFKYGMFYLLNVLHNPKAEKAYSIAWDERHSAGIGEVADMFEDLAELLG